TTFYADSSTASADTAWWELFGDTVLTNLVTTGIMDNTDVRAAAARVEELMGRYGVTKSDFFPKIDATGNAARGQFGSGLEDTGNGPRPTGNAFSVDLGATWEVDLWGRIRRANEAAKANLLASEAARRGVVLSTAALIANSYIDLLALDRQLEIARQTAESRQHALDLFAQRRAKGDLSDLEYSQAESEYWLAKSQIPVFQKQITFVEDTINFLLGRNPQPIMRGSVIDSLALPAVPVGVPSSLLERRPDVVFAEEQLRAANARIGVARSLYFPTISLSGLLGVASNDLSHLFDTDAGVWNVSGSVFQPIFHWGEIGGEVKASEGVQKQALYGYVGTVRNAFRETEDALTNRTRTGEQLEAQAGRVKALALYARLARMRYDEGVTDYLEVLDAERSLFSSELDYTRTQAELYKSVVDIYRVMAGGWLDRAAVESFRIEEDVTPRQEH
ncbi:MAG TPA: efflux transporter outer membrane subunit, partial [Candidatus Krumholzibacteria bacterium]|nr:efflux transporter outer membrane subunit [Candidatus Krumholzibacteria bacterium]